MLVQDLFEGRDAPLYHACHLLVGLKILRHIDGIIEENASSGATGSASIATAVGGLGSGFAGPSGDYGIYQKKKQKPLIVRRQPITEENHYNNDGWIIPDGTFIRCARLSHESMAKKYIPKDQEKFYYNAKSWALDNNWLRVVSSPSYHINVAIEFYRVNNKQIATLIDWLKPLYASEIICDIILEPTKKWTTGNNRIELYSEEETYFETTSIKTSIAKLIAVIKKPINETIASKSTKVNESDNLKYNLGNLCDIRTNFPEADFWMIRKGSDTTVGTPTKTFSPEYIGVRVLRTDILLPQYLFYAIQYLQMRGEFKKMATGMLKLVHIKVDQVKSIVLE